MKLQNHKIELKKGTTNIKRTVYNNYVLYKNKVEGKEGYEYVIFKPMECGCWAIVAEHRYNEENKELHDRDMLMVLDRKIKNHQSAK